jgi:F420-0:gamma-glutamyl ligase
MNTERKFGTVVRGLRGPIIRQGDDLKEILVNTFLEAVEQEQIPLNNRDILCVTEAVVARAQGNYATIHQIGEDVREKLGGKTIGVIFPILSRNRFAICLRGIARGAEKIVLMLSYPCDEVGNHLIDPDVMDEKNVNPYSDTLTLEQYRELFGYEKHTFTGVDYVEYYQQLIQEEGAECEVIFSNDPRTVLQHTSRVLTCDIHSRKRTKRILKEGGAELVFGLDEILNQPVNGSGYNAEYGLLGSNKATEESVKLFPNDCMTFVKEVQQELFEKTGKGIEVMVYGDGAFKDPVGKIWELADPVVSPGYTSGLVGTPFEVKLKYLADNDFKDLCGEELKKAISDYISHKGEGETDPMMTQGTTPRNLTDLIGSLCDLTSGSGDKGTPFVFIQGYFDNYTK